MVTDPQDLEIVCPSSRLEFPLYFRVVRDVRKVYDVTSLGS